MQWLQVTWGVYQLPLRGPSSKNQGRAQRRLFVDTSLSHEHYKEKKPGGWKFLVTHFAFRRCTQLTLLRSPKGGTCYVPVCQHCLVHSDLEPPKGEGLPGLKVHAARCHAAVSFSWLLPHPCVWVGGRRRRRTADRGCKGFAGQLGPS